MIRSIVAHFQRRADAKATKALATLAAELEAATSALEGESDAALRKRFAALRGDATFDDVAAVACAAEAVRRVLGMAPRPGQRLAALHMVRGDVVELATGEGKTLAIAMAAIVRTCLDASVHVLTPNGYLAARDAALALRVARFFGVGVGHVTQRTSRALRRIAYRKPITYASSDVVVFDAMRDERASRDERSAIHVFGTAIVDELDSMLIDASSLPLVLGRGEQASTLAVTMARIVGKLEPELDFVVDERTASASFTDRGYDVLSQALRSAELLVHGLFDEASVGLVTESQLALEARTLLRANEHYLVRDKRIVPLSKTTGRAHHSRRFGLGMQAALEAKEAVPIGMSTEGGDSTTYGVFIARYQRFAGATATLNGLDDELEKTFDKKIVRVPSDSPSVRVDEPDRFFTTDAERMRAVVVEVASAHAAGQPVLVATTTELAAEVIARALEAHGLAPTRLTAKNPEQEAAIVADAAAPSAITVTTQVAGRGTDIALGGAAKDPQAAARAREAGGLLVLGVEHQHALRVDAQLRGRSGRRGEPGRTVFFVSLEDELLRMHVKEDIRATARATFVRGTPEAVFRAGSELVAQASERAEERASEARRGRALKDRRRIREARVVAALRARLRQGRPETPSSGEREVRLGRANIARRIEGILRVHVAKSRAEASADEPAFGTLGVRPRRLMHALNARLGVELERLPPHDSLESLADALTQHVHGVLEDRLDWALEIAGKELAPSVLAYVRQGKPWVPLMAFRARYLEALDERFRAHAALTEDDEIAVALTSLAERDPALALERRVHDRFQQLLRDVAEDGLAGLLSPRSE